MALAPVAVQWIGFTASRFGCRGQAKRALSKEFQGPHQARGMAAV